VSVAKAKVISVDQLRKLEARDLDPVRDDKTSLNKDPLTDIKEIKAIAEQASAKAETAEKSIQAFTEINSKQLDQMQLLIEKISIQENAPPITGFKLIRGTDGYTDTVKLIRSKRVVN
jgi:hypothetical protein